ncbi:MAG: viroplasmin family protein [Bacillaceae bacterium]
MAVKKYYVIWAGKKTGIFTTWDECKQYVTGFKGARYKSFSSKEEAEAAFKGETRSSGKTDTYIAESLCVDAACSGNPGLMEYQGVYTKTGKQIFHFGPVENGTNNIGEYLAIVHGLSYLKKHNIVMPIYTDSQTAISWVRNKKANTSIARNEKTERLWTLIERANNWLKENKVEVPIIKWETDNWGEIKADFGRK